MIKLFKKKNYAVTQEKSYATYNFTNELSEKVWFLSDLHLFHNREFLFKPRGFTNSEDMSKAIIDNWNAVVGKYDDAFILGDLMLNNNEAGIELLKKLNGRIHIIRGNHDTDNRIKLFMQLPNVVEIVDGKYLRYKKYHFYLCHFPALTGNLENESLTQMTCCIFGHTHSKDEFFEDRPYMYNVACDAHNCTPIEINEIIKRMREKVEECKKML